MSDQDKIEDMREEFRERRLLASLLEKYAFGEGQAPNLAAIQHNEKELQVLAVDILSLEDDNNGTTIMIG